MDKVIFDTNAYRYLVHGKRHDKIEKIVGKLKAKEKKNNIETLISPIVAKELLAHIGDKNDPSFNKCLKAVKALYLHSGDDIKYNMIASPELLISKAFFNKELPAKSETNKAIGQMIYHLAKNPDAKALKRLNRNLQANRSHVIDTEYNFALQMKQFVSTIDNTATGWQIFPNDALKRKEVLDYIRSEHVSFQIALGFIFLVYQILCLSGVIAPMPNAALYDRYPSGELPLITSTYQTHSFSMEPFTVS
jgi:hypothetical protein